MVGVAEGGGAFSRSLDHAALAEVKTFCNGRGEGRRERERESYNYTHQTNMYKVSALHTCVVEIPKTTHLSKGQYIISIHENRFSIHLETNIRQ